MTENRIYPMAFAAGLSLGIVLAIWQLISGAPAGVALLWALAGLGVAFLFALIAKLGLLLQHRDVPSPRTNDTPEVRRQGRYDKE